MAGDSGKSWLASLAVYRQPQVLTLLFLGFSSGLPLLLVTGTLAARLAEAGTSLTQIGLFTLATSAYGFKWLWSPLVDRLPLPGVCRWWGQRRGWMVASQVLTAATLLGLGVSDPAQGLLIPALWAVAVSFASATQDIVIDAYRVETLPRSELGAGAGVIVLGYRLGMVVAGGGALILADAVGWTLAYAVMAGLMSVGVVATLLRPEPQALAPSVVVELAAGASRGERLRAWMQQAVVAPLADFAQRRGWVAILAFIAFYKYGDALLSAMATPFYLSLGFSKTEIGLVSKTYGVTFTILGGLGGGVLVARWGIFRALMVCGVLQALSHGMFIVQAYAGHTVPVLMLTIAVENLAAGMGSAAFVAYLSSLCNVAYTATQYALVSSLMATARTYLASSGGWLAEQLGWIPYFFFTTLAAIPGLVLLWWLMRIYPAEKE